MMAIPHRFIMRESAANVTAGSPFRYYKVFLLIIESAAIYSTAVLIEIILYFSNSNAFYIVYDPIAQLTVSVSLCLASRRGSSGRRAGQLTATAHRASSRR